MENSKSKWIVGGIIALIAVVILGAGYYFYRSEQNKSELKGIIEKLKSYSEYEEYKDEINGVINNGNIAILDGDNSRINNIIGEGNNLVNRIITQNREKEALKEEENKRLEKIRGKYSFEIKKDDRGSTLEYVLFVGVADESTIIVELQYSNSFIWEDGGQGGDAATYRGTLTRTTDSIYEGYLGESYLQKIKIIFTDDMAEVITYDNIKLNKIK